GYNTVSAMEDSLPYPPAFFSTPIRIERIETLKTPPRWGLLRILTDQGITGYGEFTLEGQLDAVEALVHQLASYVIGKDAREFLRINRSIFNHHFYHSGPHFASALAGIEIALWDINGKATGQPIHRMLGGKVRDKVKVYRWAGGNNNDAKASAEEALRVVEVGALALKMNACPPMASIDTYGGVRNAVERAMAVRAAVGPEIDIAFDFHGRCNVPNARRLARELEIVEPLFYEEPVRPDYNRWLPEIAAITHVPIATGERMSTVSEFSDVVAAKGAHILQPDLVHVGGIKPTAEIAALATANGIAVAPHCPLSAVAFMASLHVVAQSPAGWIMEWSKGIHYNTHGASGSVDPFLRYLPESDWPLFDTDDSAHIAVPEKPGLGIEIDWKEAKAAAEQGTDWRDIAMFLPDGTHANW
ncbi:MAG: galactonate dehydratase, partial [Bryobacterales bacterium]|nr:galactonate dehydratase [Bryobacterales bacterium]